MKSLKDRWLSAEGILLHSSIVECFMKGAEISTINGIAKHNNRWDLRGMTIPAKLKFEKRSFRSIDFSHATLSEVIWEYCHFFDVVFVQSKIEIAKFWVCKFERVEFSNCRLKGSFMNASLGADTGSFRDVIFNKADLAQSMHGYAPYENCSFTDCNLKLVDFNGSRFANTKFKGKIEETFFRGYPLYNKALFPNMVLIQNRMENVDFRDALLYSVGFLDRIDLSTCLFPESEDYIVIRKNREQIFAEARNIIDSSWAGNERLMGLSVVDRSYLERKKKDLQIEVVDKHFLNDTKQPFGNMFFELIRTLHVKYNR